MRTPKNSKKHLFQEEKQRNVNSAAEMKSQFEESELKSKELLNEKDANCEKLQANLDEYTADITNLKETVNKLQKELHEANIYYKATQSNLQMQMEEKSTLQKERDMFQAQIHTMESEMKETEGKEKEMKDCIQELKVSLFYQQ